MSRKNIKLGVQLFLLNLIAMSVLHSGVYAKRPLDGMLQTFLWDCVQSAIFAVLFALIVNLLFSRWKDNRQPPTKRI
jgi:hypothetical protein